MFDPICRKCNKPLSQHCEFERGMPDGCQCDLNSWPLSKPVLPVCSFYEPFWGNDDAVCARCEHERKCHRQEKPTKISKARDLLRQFAYKAREDSINNDARAAANGSLECMIEFLEKVASGWYCTHWHCQEMTAARLMLKELESYQE